jgi:hypothetical protein
MVCTTPYTFLPHISMAICLCILAMTDSSTCSLSTSHLHKVDQDTSVLLARDAKGSIPSQQEDHSALHTIISKHILTQHHRTKTATNQLTHIPLPLHHHPNKRHKRHHLRTAQRTSANRSRHPLTDIVYQHDGREEDPGVVRAV